MSELIIDKLTTRDGSNVGAIVVADIDELLLLNTNKEINTTAIVKDSNRGGVFNYDGAQSGVNNGGTIFNGWVRQYEGAVNVKWFGVIGDGSNELPLIQKAFDYISNKGGEIQFTDALSFYGIDDTIVIAGTASITVTWIDSGSYLKLLTPTATGGIFKVADGSDIIWNNPRIDSNNIIGQNGIGTSSNATVTIFGGGLVNFKSANDFTGGKPIANDGWGANISITGTKFSNCHSGLNLKRDKVTDSSDEPLNFVGTDLIFENCDMVAYFGMKNVTSKNGSLMSIKITNFIALNCGDIGGVFVYDRASNVNILGGSISSTGLAPDSIFRGRCSNSTIEGVTVNQSATSLIDIDPLANYSEDTSLMSGNKFNIVTSGTYDYIFKSDLTDSTYTYRFLNHTEIKVNLINDVNTSIVTPATRNGSTRLEITSGVKKMSNVASKFNAIYPTVASFPDVILEDYETGTFLPSFEGSSGSIGSTAYNERTGSYVRIGKMVFLNGFVNVSNVGSWADNVRIGNLPFSSGLSGFENQGSVELRNATFTGNYANIEIGRAASNKLEIKITSSGANSTGLNIGTGVSNGTTFIFSIAYKVA